MIIIYIILELCAALMLGGAISDYKNGKYYLGSFQVVAAIVNLLYVIKYIFVL